MERAAIIRAVAREIGFVAEGRRIGSRGAGGEEGITPEQSGTRRLNHRVERAGA
jgi:hypothetical protein